MEGESRRFKLVHIAGNETHREDWRMTIDITEELAGARLGSFHWRLCALIGAIAFFDGYDVFNPAYVIHYVMQPWGLRPAQAGLLVSSGLVGFLVGAALHGLVADRLGRRGTLLAGLWITSLFTLLTATAASSFLSFCVLRILTGLGLGVLLPLGTTYINEFAPRRAANAFPLWGAAFGWSLGGTAAGLVGVFVTPAWGWQSLYYLGSLSVVLAVAAHGLLPESVRFLAHAGRTAEAVALLARLRPDRAAAYAGARFTAAAAPAARPSAGALLQPRYRRTTLAIWTAAFLSLFTIFGLTGWMPTVMIGRGETFAASFGYGALMQIMSFVGGLACGMIADRRGNGRAMLVLWWALGALCVVSLALLDSHLTNLVLTGAAGFFSIGAQHVLNNVTASAYETGLRATGVGMELAVGRVGAILGPFIVGALQQADASGRTGFLALAAAGTLAAGAIACAIRDRPSHQAAMALQESGT